MPSAEDPPQQAYLPPLDRCFSGLSHLLSWSIAHELLVHSPSPANGEHLRQLLSDDLSVKALVACLQRPKSGTGHAKTDFETRTASINVTPSDTGHYDIKQIKDDALWLAKHAGTDEVTALRSVVLEWQNRPVDDILRGYSEEENISLRQAAGASLAASSFLSASTFGRSVANPLQNGRDASHSDVRRHSSILQTHLREHERLLAIAVFLETSLLFPQNAPAQLAWVKDVASRVSEARAAASPANVVTPAQRLDLALDALDRQFQALEEDLPWAPEEITRAVYSNVQRRRLLETAHLLRLVYMEAKSSSHLTSARGITAWFRIMEGNNFLHFYEVTELDHQTLLQILHSLCALISVQLLDCLNAQEILQSDLPPDSSSLYAFDNECCRQICSAMSQAAANGIHIAAPAMLSWSSVGCALRAMSDSSRRRSLDLDSDDGSRSPIMTRSNGTALGDACQYLQDMDLPLDPADKDATSRDPLRHLAMISIDILKAFDVVARLATFAKSLGAPGPSHPFDLCIRQTLLDVVRNGSEVTSYSADLLEAAIAVVKPTSDTPTVQADISIADDFLSDSRTLLPKLLRQAKARYPYELTAFLQLFESLAAGGLLDQDGMPVLSQALRATGCLTIQLPAKFGAYELFDDEIGRNAVQLTGDLPLFLPPNAPQFGGVSAFVRSSSLVVSNANLRMSIPTGTVGEVLTDNRPFVAAWNYSHSIFAYLAALLSTALSSSDSHNISDGLPVHRGLQAGIIRLFATQIDLLQRGSSAPEAKRARHDRVKAILEEASDSLQRDQDIISIVGEILENELSAQPIANDDSAVDILAASVSFLRSVLPVLPDRIWPQLARAGLADSNERGGQFSAVIASVEIASGRYACLVSCLSLFDKLVDDVVQNAVSRQGPKTVSASRFQQENSTGTGIPHRMVGQIVESFTRLFLDVQRSTHDWRFADVNDQLRINATIVEVFGKIIRLVYAFDDAETTAAKLCAPLIPAAKILVDTYCSEAGGDLSIDAVLRLCAPLTETALDTVTTTSALIRRQATASLTFLQLLLQIGGALSLSCVSLKKQLFQSVPALVRIYVGEQPHKLAVASLLASLVRAAGADGREPPSLFGHLGPDVAQKTLLRFSDLSALLDDADSEGAVWDLFSAVVSHRQQWIATFLLTGNIPSKSYKDSDDKTKAVKSGQSVFDTALDRLCEHADLGSRQVAGMLQFVVDSVNNWPWSVGRIKAHPHFLDRMCFKMMSLDTKPRDTSSGRVVALAWQTRSMSLLSQLFAMYLHNMRRMGDTSFAEKLAEAVYFFKDSCVGDPSYATSLHLNLKRNLEGKLPDCSIMSFKGLLPGREFGPNYFYDLDFAAQALSDHVNWAGGKRESGFEGELKRANHNLSLVEAQMQNLKSWKMLAIEFSNYCKGNANLQKRLAYVVHECLDANRNARLEALVFEKLAEIRAELALPILQRLVDARSDIDSMQSLLALAWNAILASEQDFDSVLIGKDSDYYRLLLRLLLLTLQPQAYRALATGAESESQAAMAKEEEKVGILLLVTRDVVCRGFKSLCGQLHEQAYSVLPSDLSLLTTIFQSVMRVQTRERSGLLPRMGLVLMEQRVTRYATSLFSWSDRLTAANDDPIFGEISMLFLYEMSSIASVGEMLAADGVLAQLNAANMTGLFRRRGGSGAFDEPTRMFTIWSRGILPVCLNVLVAAGAAFAPEVATFLNNFGPQLERAGTALDASGPAMRGGAGGVTLSAACEAQTLALISTALEQSGQDDSELQWDRAGVRADIEGWVQGTRAALRERIVPTTEKELALQRAKASNSDSSLCGCESRLEEMVLQELKGALFVLSGGGGPP